MLYGAEFFFGLTIEQNSSDQNGIILFRFSIRGINSLSIATKSI